MNDIAHDVLQVVFGFSQTRDIITMCATCSHWRALLEHDTTWQLLYVRYMPKRILLYQKHEKIQKRLQKELNTRKTEGASRVRHYLWRYVFEDKKKQVVQKINGLQKDLVVKQKVVRDSRYVWKFPKQVQKITDCEMQFSTILLLLDEFVDIYCLNDAAAIRSLKTLLWHTHLAHPQNLTSQHIKLLIDRKLITKDNFVPVLSTIISSIESDEQCVDCLSTISDHFDVSFVCHEIIGRCENRFRYLYCNRFSLTFAWLLQHNIYTKFSTSITNYMLKCAIYPYEEGLINLAFEYERVHLENDRPALFACILGYGKQILKKVLNAGFDPIFSDGHGNLMHLVCASDIWIEYFKDVCQIIGLERAQSLINMVDGYGETPLFKLKIHTLGGEIVKTEYILKLTFAFQELHADPFVKNNQGITFDQQEHLKNIIGADNTSFSLNEILSSKIED
jgi:hypothetical protein